MILACGGGLLGCREIYKTVGDIQENDIEFDIRQRKEKKKRRVNIVMRQKLGDRSCRHRSGS